MLRITLLCGIVGAWALSAGCTTPMAVAENDGGSMDARTGTDGAGDVDSGLGDVDSGAGDDGAVGDVDAAGAGDDAAVSDVDAGTSCVDTGCGAGQECCAATGACYGSGCLACCMPRPIGDGGIIGGRDGGIVSRDSGIIVGRDSGIIIRRDSGIIIRRDSGIIIRRDSGIAGRDGGTSCVDTGCGAGQLCCAGTGRCYASGCLGCCMLPL